MKILFLAHRTPYPPNKGEKIRAYHILSYLARSHFVSLAYWLDDPQDTKHAATLRNICRGDVIPVELNRSAANARGLLSLIRGKSISEGYFYSRKFQRVVNAILSSRRYDIIYVFSSVMAQYVEKAAGLNRIVDYVDVDSDKWGQFAQFKKFPLSKLYRLECARLARYEVEVSQWAARSLFVSQAEVDTFREMGGKSYTVLPNGVEVDLSPLNGTAKCAGETGSLEQTKPVRLLFVGTMNYYPNTDAVSYFVREIFPLVRKKYPGAVFEIAGRCPVKSVRILQKVSGVRVLGEVADVFRLLLKADVSVAPIRIARGVQNKVLEAMAAGIPVVASSEAIKGLQVRDGEELLVADDPALFATQISKVLSDARLRLSLVERARRRVKESYNWKSIGLDLERIIRNSAARAARKVPSMSEQVSAE